MADPVTSGRKIRLYTSLLPAHGKLKRARFVMSYRGMLHKGFLSVMIDDHLSHANVVADQGETRVTHGIHTGKKKGRGLWL